MTTQDLRSSSLTSDDTSDDHQARLLGLSFEGHTLKVDDAFKASSPRRAAWVYLWVTISFAKELARALAIVGLNGAAKSVEASATELIAASAYCSDQSQAPLELAERLSVAASMLRQRCDRFSGYAARRAQRAQDNNESRRMVLIAARMALVSLLAGNLERQLVHVLPHTRERARRRSQPALLACAATFMQASDRLTAERYAAYLGDESLAQSWRPVVYDWAVTRSKEAGALSDIHSQIEAAAFLIVHLAATPAEEIQADEV